MEIKNKLFPYPVLSSGSDDYKDCAFSVELQLKQDGYDYILEVASNLTSQSLLELIQNGKASFVYHLECAQTGFRKVLRTNKSTYKYTLSEKDINGRLEINTFVVAMENVENYTSHEFHDDYQEQTFNIEQGCVLAIGDGLTADISKKIDDLANNPSIFNIVRNADEACQQMLVDLDGQKLIIKLPSEQFYNYKVLNKAPQVQPVINSLTLIPALTYALEYLRSIPRDERNDFSNQLWYRTIRKTMQKVFHIDIESDDYNNINSIELAQKLIGNPLTNAFNALTEDFEAESGDED